MLFQVRAETTFLNGDGALVRSQFPQFIFGTNVNASTEDTADPTTAQVAATQVTFRLIMSDLLLGNFLEDVSCRDGTYQFVPVAATPDDIAKCAVSQDVLPVLCTGANRVCVCQNPQGCQAQQLSGPPIAVQEGEPVGVLDTNEDGAADKQQFHDGSVEIICTGASGTVRNAPLDLGGNDNNGSYWTPSGDQQEPAEGVPSPFDLLGPAVVLVPRSFDPNLADQVTDIMPSNSTCVFKFSSTVVDKKGEQPCAPVGGFGGSGVVASNLHCTPGDFSAATFRTEPMTFNATHGDGSVPFTGSGASVDVPRTDSIAIATSDGIPLDASSIGGIELLEGSNVYNQVTISIATPDSLTIQLTNPTGLDPDTDYTLVVPTTVTDSFGEPAAQGLNIPFHTGM